MKRASSKLCLVIACIALPMLLLFGCGGGGGGGGGTGGGVNVVISPLSVTLAPNGVQQFSATVSGASGTVNFTASAGTITVIDSTDISYQAPAAAGKYTVTASIDGARSTAAVTVSGGGGQSAPVSGRVTDDTGFGLANITVVFVDASAKQVASVVTSGSGAFSTSVPISAKAFTLHNINLNFDYSSYLYNLLIYDPSIAGCTTPLPALTSGKAVVLSAIVVASNTGPPPPPPTGCQ